MRPYLSLDEALVNDCCVIHDQAEGLLGVDVADPKKTHQNDLDEYEAFKELYGHVDRIVWESKQRSFLLQFCLKNPECFDTEARAVMTELAKTKRNEALFFRGMEMLDYLYYAYENGALGKVPDILKEVSANQVANLDRIAEELPGFSAVVWTPEIRTFFAGAAGLSPKQDAFLV